MRIYPTMLESFRSLLIRFAYELKKRPLPVLFARRLRNSKHEKTAEDSLYDDWDEPRGYKLRKAWNEIQNFGAARYTKKVEKESEIEIRNWRIFRVTHQNAGLSSSINSEAHVPATQKSNYNNKVSSHKAQRSR